MHSKRRLNFERGADNFHQRFLVGIAVLVFLCILSLSQFLSPAATSALETLTSRRHMIEKQDNRVGKPIGFMLEGDPLSQYPPIIGGHWDSGFPYLSTDHKVMGFQAGIQLLLFKIDTSDLKELILSMPTQYWDAPHQKKYNVFLLGRSTNLEKFKPGTKAIHLIFSNQAGDEVYQFPWYDIFSSHLDPLLIHTLGADVSKIIRCQLTLMPAGAHIKPHVDKGGYSALGHRIHIVIASELGNSFHVCEHSKCVALHVEEGMVFELNNRVQHHVSNNSTGPRVHVVVDVGEEKRVRTILPVGATCSYISGDIVCNNN